MGWGAAAAGVAGLIGATGQKNEAKSNNKYQQQQVDNAYNYANQQLNALFGSGGIYNQIYEGEGSILDILAQGTQQGINALNPFAQGGADSFNLYNQALQGGEGAADAFAAFQDSTGYNFLRDEALEATSRQFGAMGKTNSGNVLAALQDRSAGLASQSFNDYMAQLLGSSQIGLSAAGAQADIYGQGAAAQAGALSNRADAELRARLAAMGGGFGLGNTALGNTQGASEYLGQSTQNQFNSFGNLLGTLFG